MGIFTIKLGARIPAYGEVEIEAESPQGALAEFLADPFAHEFEWDEDYALRARDITVDAVAWEESEVKLADIQANASTEAALAAFTAGPIVGGE